MINCNIESILDTYKSDVRRDRALKVKLGQLKQTDHEGKQYIKNELVRDRWLIIALYKHMDKLYECKKIYDNDYEYFESINDAVRRAETYLEISEINNLIKDISKHIANLGEIFIEILSLNILSEHDVCQLLNINWKNFQNKKQIYKNKFGEKDNLTYKIVSVAGAEYRDGKGKLKDIYDCHEYEMPIYWAIGDRIMQEMDNNEEFHKIVRQGIKKFFPGIKTYKVVKDLEGNIVKVVEGKEENSNKNN